jgi:hypothetical protein
LPALGPLRLRDRRGFVEKPPTPCGRPEPLTGRLA